MRRTIQNFSYPGSWMTKASVLRLRCGILATLLLVVGLWAISSPARAAGAGDCLVMQPNATQKIQAAVPDIEGSDLVWMVNGVPGGAPEIGMIDDQGEYTAPANMDKTVNVTIAAASRADATKIAEVSVCNEVFSRPGNVYHVATTGFDKANGSSRSPWRSIQHAVDHVRPGDTILVHGGVYNEAVLVTRSGSAEGGYITLMEAPGESAIIDGANLARQSHGMRGLITLADVSYFRVKDFEIRNFKSDTEFIVIGVLVQGSGKHIEIRNNVIHGIQAHNPPSNGNADALGIAVYGQTSTPIKGVIVDGNELFDLKTGTSESLTIGGNVEGWQITNNKVHDNDFIGIDATGYYNSGAEHDRARRGWIAGNTVYGLSSAENRALTFVAAAIGIYVDGGRDITIERNTVSGNDGGIWLLSERPGKNTSNVIVRNNLVHSNRDAGILVGGYDATQSGGANNCTVVNNTFFQNNARDVPGIHSGEFQIGHGAIDVTFQNNILYAGQKGYVITKFTPEDSSSVTIGHNIYFSSSGADHTKWFWADQNYYNDHRMGPDFEAFQSATGGTRNGSLVADPEFVNVQTLDLRLKAGSPGIDSGLYDAGLGMASTGLLDYAGNPRVRGSTIDRGAYERGE